MRHSARLPLYITIATFLIAFGLCVAQYPNMLSTRVIANLLTDNAFLGIVAVGNDVQIRGSKQTGSILIDRMTVAGE